MKAKIAAVWLMQAAIFSVVANAGSDLLLLGEVHAPSTMRDPITGAKKAIIKAGSDQITVSAGRITFDPTVNALICAGASTITTAGRTVTGNNLKIELGSDIPRVFILNPKGVLELGQKRDFESWRPDRELPEFRDELPKTQVNLRKLNE